MAMSRSTSTSTSASTESDRLLRDLEQAAVHLAAGGLLAYPTETSWGLAARIDSPRAVASLRAFKGRDADKPLSLLVSGEAALAARGAFVGDAARALMRAFWPGPLTLVLPDHSHVRGARVVPGRGARGAHAENAENIEKVAPASHTGNTENAAPASNIENAAHAANTGNTDNAAPADNPAGRGFRCSPHPAAQALALWSERRGIGPFTATSLNLSGRPACDDFAAAMRLVESAPAPPPGSPGLCILDINRYGDAGGMPASTVLDVQGDRPRILRAGAIAREQLDAALADAGAVSTAP